MKTTETVPTSLHNCVLIENIVLSIISANKN